jgi:hypothetical protein
LGFHAAARVIGGDVLSGQPAGFPWIAGAC